MAIFNKAVENFNVNQIWHGQTYGKMTMVIYLNCYMHNLIILQEKRLHFAGHIDRVD